VKKGSLIIFSGLDNSGKSTCVQHTIRILKRQNLRVETIWIRGGYTRRFDLLKKLFGLHGKGKTLEKNVASSQRRSIKAYLLSKLWLNLAITDLCLEMIIIRFKLFLGKWIVADRFVQDSLIDFKHKFLVYYNERGFFTKLLLKLAPIGDIHFMMIVSPEISIRRSIEKNEPFPAPFETTKARYQDYLKLIDEKKDMIVINTDLHNISESIEIVENTITKLLSDRRN